MKKILATFFIILLHLTLVAQERNDRPLEENFQNPPHSAKARTWWHWLNGNVSREGITADLEAMKNVGIQEAQIFNVNLGHPQGPATYLSPEWLEFFYFAASEAQRLGLELAFHNGAGWSSSGGPWITPAYAMQTLVYSEVSHEGGKAFKEHLPQPEIRLNYYKDIAILAFPKPKNNERIDDLDFKNLSGRVRNHLEPDAKLVPASAVVKKTDIIDLTSQLTEDGFLEWNAPAGEWIILRLGHTPTGKNNHPAPVGGQGLECDKMSRKAVDVFWQGGINPILEKLDTLVGTVLTNCLIDSYEVGTTNWTAGFDDEFKRLRDYDMSLFLPTMAGYYVESGEITERFLWDYRRTIGDLIAENYYAYFRERCHQHGLKLSVEPYWGPFDNMQVGATGDIVVCEFWSGNLAFFDSPKFVASIAKLNGNSIVGAEAFTASGGWLQHPGTLKSIGDRAWAQGINRFIFHTYAHQPWNVGPGITLGPYGIDFNRLNTWWEQGKAFQDYIARSQFLLQLGQSVADVLVFTGESSPNDALLMPEIKDLGYDYDLIGANKMNLLTVEDGLICTPLGGKYRALVLPKTKWMTPKTLYVIGELAQAGATIIGTKPHKSPSLQNYPECDAQVTQLAQKLWESGFIKDGSIVNILKKGILPPDFSIDKGSRGEDLDFIHRKAKETDIYFLANARKESRQELCRFRITGKQPEIWNAETAEITDAVVWQDNGDGTTSILIQFDSEGAIFVIFRKPVDSSGHIVKITTELDRPKRTPLLNLEIINAEYGIFLQDGLVDVTEVVASRVQNNQLNIDANRGICSCDPAPGYKKELRVEYKIGDTQHETYAREKETLLIDAEDKGELTILKAVFGKFERGVSGVPSHYPVYDITEKIKLEVSSGVLEIPVGDGLVDGISDIGKKKALHILYTTNGELCELTIPEGRTLNLFQPILDSKLINKDGEVQWVTPYPGRLTYTTSLGKTETVQVRSVPEPIELIGPWDVHFPFGDSVSAKTTFDQLTSWPSSSDEAIRYFSGTATYKKQFVIPKHLLLSQNSFELDLGSVYVMAEVVLNGKNLGVLWKVPFSVNIDDFVTEGINNLEVKITNLWPNRLIGDKQLPKDFESRGASIKYWPDWLLNQTKRPTERLTFAGHQHWNKDAKLQPSGLLGPVKINCKRIIEIIQ